MNKDQIVSALNEMGISVECEFVPLSSSRNSKPEYKSFDDLSLNWRVQLRRKGRTILTADYQQGCGYAPAYDHPSLGTPKCIMRFETLLRECETGITYHYDLNGSFALGKGRAIDQPDSLDVLYCLVLDADVLDYSGFEEWADNYGYDPDSRKAEATYKECLSQSLKLRTGLGAHYLPKLQELFQDY